MNKENYELMGELWHELKELKVKEIKLYGTSPESNTYMVVIGTKK